MRNIDCSSQHHNTREMAEKVFNAMGIEGNAKELLLRAGAASRHQARVDATIAAAQAAAIVDPVTYTRAAAYFWLLMDYHGCGGPLAGAFGGKRTDRLPEFSKLGKGRWLASDGNAYRAAALEALAKLRLEDAGCLVVDWEIVDTQVTWVVYWEKSQAESARIPTTKFPMAWNLSLAAAILCQDCDSEVFSQVFLGGWEDNKIRVVLNRADEEKVTLQDKADLFNALSTI
jgi:hypothetical protein